MKWPAAGSEPANITLQAKMVITSEDLFQFPNKCSMVGDTSSSFEEWKLQTIFYFDFRYPQNKKTITEAATSLHDASTWPAMWGQWLNFRTPPYYFFFIAINIFGLTKRFPWGVHGPSPPNELSNMDLAQFICITRQFSCLLSL